MGLYGALWGSIGLFYRAPSLGLLRRCYHREDMSKNATIIKIIIIKIGIVVFLPPPPPHPPDRGGTLGVLRVWEGDEAEKWSHPRLLLMAVHRQKGFYYHY